MNQGPSQISRLSRRDFRVTSQEFNELVTLVSIVVKEFQFPSLWLQVKKIQVFPRISTVLRQIFTPLRTIAS